MILVISLSILSTIWLTIVLTINTRPFWEEMISMQPIMFTARLMRYQIDDEEGRQTDATSR